MAWAEEQSWFGLEDIALECIENQNQIRENFIYRNIWTTQDNCEIHISQMTVTHIKNCVNKCRREQWRLWALPILENELNKRFKSYGKK